MGRISETGQPGIMRIDRGIGMPSVGIGFRFLGMDIGGGGRTTDQPNITTPDERSATPALGTARQLEDLRTFFLAQKESKTDGGVQDPLQSRLPLFHEDDPSGRIREFLRKTTVTELRELDLTNRAQVGAYVDMLNFRGLNKDGIPIDNRSHFADPPVGVSDMLHRAEDPRLHPLVVLNVDGQVIGGATVEDASRNQHDHFLVWLVVHPDYPHRGIGKTLVRKTLDWAAIHPASDGRRREKMDIAIITGIPGARHMRSLVTRKIGIAERVGGLRKQVDTEIWDPKKDTITQVRRPTVRFEVDLDEWIELRGLEVPVFPERPEQ